MNEHQYDTGSNTSATSATETLPLITWEEVQLIDDAIIKNPNVHASRSVNASLQPLHVFPDSGMPPHTSAPFSSFPPAQPASQPVHASGGRPPPRDPRANGMIHHAPVTDPSAPAFPFIYSPRPVLNKPIFESQPRHGTLRPTHPGQPSYTTYQFGASIYPPLRPKPNGMGSQFPPPPLPISTPVAPNTGDANPELTHLRAEHEALKRKYTTLEKKCQGLEARCTTQEAVLHQFTYYTEHLQSGLDLLKQTHHNALNQPPPSSLNDSSLHDAKRRKQSSDHSL